MGVEKKIITEGNGKDFPKTGQTVEIHYTGTLADGSQFDSSRERGETIKFKMGQGEAIQGWEQSIATMSVGERAMLTISPDLAYRSQGSPPTIPPNATLIFDIELISLQ